MAGAEISVRRTMARKNFTSSVSRPGGGGGVDICFSASLAWSDRSSLRFEKDHDRIKSYGTLLLPDF